MPLVPTRNYSPLDDTDIAAHTETRPQGKLQLSYLPAGFIIQRLLEVFPGYSWTIVQQREALLGDQIVVVTHGTLRVLIDGTHVAMEGVGTEVLMDHNIGNVHKASETDALKRAAMKLGMQFGLSLYPGTEAASEEPAKPVARVQARPPIQPIEEIEIPPPTPKGRVTAREMDYSKLPTEQFGGECQYLDYRTRSAANPKGAPCKKPTGMTRGGEPMKFCATHIQKLEQYKRGQNPS